MSESDEDEGEWYRCGDVGFRDIYMEVKGKVDSNNLGPDLLVMNLLVNLGSQSQHNLSRQNLG